MPRYFSYVTPDTRTRRLEEHTQREFQRKLRLDAAFKQKNDEIKAQTEQEQLRGLNLSMETEKARGLQLDQANTRTQFETETARGLELDENRARFNEVDRQVPSSDVRRGMAAAQAAGKKTFAVEGGETILPGGLPPALNAPRDVAGAVSRFQGSPQQAAQVAGQAVAGTKVGDVIRRGVEEFETRVSRPFGAAALQIAESPAGGGLLGVTELKTAQRGLEDIGVPEELSPLPRERTFAEALEGGFVDPFKALAGNKEEQEKAVAVMEEAGLPRAMAAEILADPTNLLPGLGLTKVDDAVRFGRLVVRAVRATPKARTAAVQTLRESGLIQQALKGAREAGEAGGGKLGDIPPLRGGEEAAELAAKGPLKTGIAKLTRALRVTSQRRTPLELQRTGQRIERVATERQMLDDLLAQGVPPQEAIPRARAAFKGEMAKAEGVLLDLTEAEQDAFWKVLTEHPLAFERQRGYDAVMKLASSEPLQPNEVALLRRLYGDEIGDLAEASGATTRQMLKELGEDFPKRLPKPKGITPEEAGLPAGVEFETKIPAKEFTGPGKSGTAGKSLNIVTDLFHLPTALLSLLDNSWGGRQLRMMLGGGFIGPRTGRLPISLRWPKTWAKAYWEPTALMFRSDKARIAYDAKMLADDEIFRVWTASGYEDIPYGELWERTGGHYPLPNSPEALATGVREERMPSGLLTRLPGFKQTAEGFTLGVNSAHHSTLKDMLRTIAAGDERLTLETVQSLANLTSRHAGRGFLGQSLPAKIVKAVGWAPGLRLAFWQSLFRLAHPNPVVRAAAARQTAGYIGFGLSLMGLADLSGAGQVTWDPRNTDFGKIKIKGIRFNVWGPDVVAVRYLAQGIFGYATSPLTGKRPVDWKQALANYARSGANPVVGLGLDAYTGETYVGDKFNWLDWQERLPLATQDIIDAWNLKEGVWKPIASAAVAPFVSGGVGVQSYDAPKDKLARAYNDYVDAGRFGKDALYYADEDGLTIRANVQKMPDLAKLDSERNLTARMENNEIKAELEQQYNLPDFAKRFNAGEVALGPELMKNWRDYRHDSRVAMQARVFGVDFGPQSEDEKLLDAWLSINRHDSKYADPVTGEPDYARIDADVDKAKAALEDANPRLVKAVSEIISSIAPDLAELEPRLDGALRLRSNLYDLPRWKGISPEKQREIEDLQELVDQFRDRLAAAGLDPGSITISQYQDAARQGGLDPGLAFVAWPLRGGNSEAQAQNPEYLKFLFEHQEDLAIFFPELYGSRAMLPFLESDIQEVVIGAGR